MLTKFPNWYIKIFFYQNGKITEEAAIFPLEFWKIATITAINTFAFF